MTEDINGKISRRHDYFEIRLCRFFEHEQIIIWQMLTEPDKLPQWLAPGKLSLVKGGSATLNFSESGTDVRSIITDVDPPSMIEYSWSSHGEPARPLRWEVDAKAGHARLSLRLRIPDTEDIARAAAGWEAHLDMLAAALEGVPIKFPLQRFKIVREAYRARVSGLTPDRSHPSGLEDAARG